MLCISSQLMGIPLSCFFKKFLVQPPSMIWPGAVVNSALFNTLHKSYNQKDGKHMSRQRFFVIAAAVSFVWHWFPGYIFTALSWFNWVCWIAPNDIVVNTLFGYASGLGMGFLTFDWAMIVYIGSPLITPVSSIESTSPRAFLTASLVVGPNEHHSLVPVLVLDHRPHHLLHEHLELSLSPDRLLPDLYEHWTAIRYSRDRYERSFRRGEIPQLLPRLHLRVARPQLWPVLRRYHFSYHSHLLVVRA